MQAPVEMRGMMPTRGAAGVWGTGRDADTPSTREVCFAPIPSRLAAQARRQVGFQCPSAIPLLRVTVPKSHPLKKLTPAEAGGHKGISQSILVKPNVDARAATIALVEYEPGGQTELHAHFDMEQAFYVLEGGASLQVGAVVKDVGSGDLILAPTLVKHGYQVSKGVPFKFLQIEWRDVK